MKNIKFYLEFIYSDNSEWKYGQKGVLWMLTNGRNLVNREPKLEAWKYLLNLSKKVIQDGWYYDEWYKVSNTFFIFTQIPDK